MKKEMILMRTIRTDLAIERRDALGTNLPEGVEIETENADGAVLTAIRVRTPDAAAALEKPVGVYYTVEIESFPDAQSLLDDRLCLLTDVLRRLLPDEGPVLVAGLGNLNATPDALGPKCVSQVLATRHIAREMREKMELPPLREVSALTPGVTGRTGIESVELLKGICDTVKPAAVIAVDALAAGSVTRLVKTVQLSSAGIEPGSGVGNARRALTRETLGVPVIAVGVPTVVDAVSLAKDVFGEADPPENAAYADLMVTPRDIDEVIDAAARLLALALNCALQKNLSARELLGLM